MQSGLEGRSGTPAPRHPLGPTATDARGKARPSRAAWCSASGSCGDGSGPAREGCLRGTGAGGWGGRPCLTDACGGRSSRKGPWERASLTSPGRALGQRTRATCADGLEGTCRPHAPSPGHRDAGRPGVGAPGAAVPRALGTPHRRTPLGQLAGLSPARGLPLAQGTQMHTRKIRADCILQTLVVIFKQSKPRL